MKKLFFFVLLLTVFSAHARTGFLEGLGIGNAEEPPLVEEAFQLSVQLNDDNSLLAHWKVLEGNYLYKDKFQFEILDNDAVRLRKINLPDGENKRDETFGLVQVYHEDVSTIIPIERPDDATSFTLKVTFQGCSDTFGICYPPTSETFPIRLATIEQTAFIAPTTTTPEAITLSEQDRITQKLEQGSLWQVLIGFLGLGLLLAFTPCVFPMIPILSSIIIGEGDHITTKRAFFLSLVYVLAMSVTYTVAGVITGLLGENLQSLFQNPWIIASFSALFVVFALSMFGLFELQLPHKLQHSLHQLHQRQQGGKLASVAVMGLLSALIVGPCLAPPLAGTLIFISQHADPYLGGAALFALSIGMGIPLLIIGTSAGKLLPKAGGWMVTIKSIFGVLLLGLAIWMLERIIPGWVSLILWGALLIISAIYMGALNRLEIDSLPTTKLLKGIGLILLIYGTLLLIGGASGSDNRWQPLKALSMSKQSIAEESHLAFTQIQTLTDLKRELANTNKPVMLDFYADWCVDCKIMEKTTFSDPAVSKAMEGYKLLQLDMTDNNEQHQALMKSFKVFGPPTMLFFDANGHELNEQRLVGLVKVEAFLAHLDKIASSAQINKKF
ncbi:MAG TPA: protein-disulfide reductase DsbD [Methylophaga aminisulfidivorans]|uniref:Thiol:disulfide interchange protein DsbD n=1 Tax=Methylophaga aminisulfidivorans TaxID=230105 RepID=A0A7C1VXZ1_9GAMM|nr:protein-disulfide reductase DsbD [Methylophaga aminisulfidivorans]